MCVRNVGAQAKWRMENHNINSVRKSLWKFHEGRQGWASRNKGNYVFLANFSCKSGICNLRDLRRYSATEFIMDANVFPYRGWNSKYSTIVCVSFVKKYSQSRFCSLLCKQRDFTFMPYRKSDIKPRLAVAFNSIFFFTNIIYSRVYGFRPALVAVIFTIGTLATV